MTLHRAGATTGRAGAGVSWGCANVRRGCADVARGCAGVARPCAGESRADTLVPGPDNGAAGPDTGGCSPDIAVPRADTRPGSRDALGEWGAGVVAVPAAAGAARVTVAARPDIRRPAPDITCDVPATTGPDAARERRVTDNDKAPRS